MKIINILAALAAATMLTVSCAADPEELKKQSREAFPNQEWRRPPGPLVSPLTLLLAGG